MDLISLAKLVDLAKSERKTCGKDYDFDGLLSDIENAPTVPAVPLDTLCEWLSENSINIPCEACPNFSNEYCTAIGDASKPCPKTANDWRRAITEWMEEPQCTSTDTEP